MSNFGAHFRSASVTGYGDNDPPKYNQTWMYRTKEPCYSSSVDINNTKQDSSDYKRFIWGAPAQYQPSNSVSSYQEPMDYSQKRRPFEDAFKSAITKMKESSLSRLGTVDKNIQGANSPNMNYDNDFYQFYQRKCQTLQPSRKQNTDPYKAETRQIFRCQPSLSKGQETVYSVSKVSKDMLSDGKRDGNTATTLGNNFQDNQNKNASYISMSKFKYVNQDKGTNTEVTNVIPMKDNKLPSVQNDHNSVKSEVYISPKLIKSNQLGPVKVFQNDRENSDENFENSPSVQEIISKVEALSNQSERNMMSKSLNLTHEKPPILQTARTGNQRLHETIQNASPQFEHQTPVQKRLSGLYKKNESSPQKGKPTSVSSSDFQKLHLAFLDQKHENQRLRQEIVEKNARINQLESELRNYEPWR